MWSNYFRIAYRQFVKYRLYSLINLSGLTIGLLVSLVILLYIVDENSFDQFHSKKESIYRIKHTRNTGNSITASAGTPLALAPIAKSEIAGISNAARILRDRYGLVQIGEKRFNEPNFAYADSSVVAMFDFEWLSGHPKSALTRPDGIVITKSHAAKYFGEENPIGQQLHYRNWGQDVVYQVTAVINDLPSNSHFHFDLIAPFESNNNLWYGMHGSDWYFAGAWTYIEIPVASDITNVRNNLADLVTRHLPDDLKSATEFDLQPLTDIHLRSSLSNEVEPNGNINYLFLQATIGLLIVIIACVNFVNLTTARASLRLKEVAMRKSLGGRHAELAFQFTCEAFFYAIFAMALALVLIPFGLSIFSSIVGRQIPIQHLVNPTVIAAILGLLAMIVILSGIYPAFYMAKLNPALYLKSSGRETSHKGSLRVVLVAGQFIVLLILLTGSLMIRKQLTFMKNKNLGFATEEIAYVDGFDNASFEQLKGELKNINGIIDVAAASGIPGSVNAQLATGLARMEGMEQSERAEIYRTRCDKKFFNLMQMKLELGHDFATLSEDSIAPVIVNRAMIDQMPWKDDPIGRKIELFNMIGRSEGERRIVGVVSDFHIESLRSQIRPVAFTFADRNPNLVIRFKSAETDQLRDEVISTLNKYRGNMAGDFYFLREDLNSQYQAEDRLSKIGFWLTSISIAIAVIGVFGLASFSAQQRLKEMSIRKVLGAQVPDVIFAFSKSFVSLVFAASVIGLPLAYFLVTQWLEDFAYKVPISWSAIGLSATSLLIIVVLITTFHALRVSRLNPAQVLRNE
ncbi:MAG: FtsX-like permease family protein [Cyclobacteriaceae bacterium]